MDDDEEYAVTCGVCFELFEDPRTLNCSHSLCNPCLVGIYKRNPSCPYCRGSFNPPLPNTNEALRIRVQQFIEKTANKGAGLSITTSAECDPQENCYFCHMPPDIFRYIYSFLPYKSLAVLNSVCRVLIPIADDVQIWRETCKRYFPFCNAENEGRSWRGAFKSNIKLKIGWDHGRPKDFKMTPWRGHTNYVNCFDLYRRNVVSGGADNKVMVWAFNSEKPVKTLEGHTGLIECVKFNELWIASGSQDGTVILWDTQTGANKYRMDHGSPVHSVFFNDQTLFCGSQGSTSLWDIRTGQRVQQYAGTSKFEIGPHSELFAYDQHGIKVYDTRNNFQVVRSLPLPLVTCMTYAGDNILAAGTQTGNLTTFNIASGVNHSAHLHNARINCIGAYGGAQGGRVVTGSNDNTLKVFDFTNNTLKSTLADHSGPVYSVQMDNMRVVSGSADGCMKVWNLETGQRLYSLLGGSLQQRGNNLPHPTRPGCSGLQFDSSRIVGSFSSLLRVYSFAPENQ